MSFPNIDTYNMVHHPYHVLTDFHLGNTPAWIILEDHINPFLFFNRAFQRGFQRRAF